MLDRMPFKGMSRDEWRQAIQATRTGSKGLKGMLSSEHIEAGSALLESIRAGKNGTATQPHWAALPMLP